MWKVKSPQGWKVAESALWEIWELKEKKKNAWKEFQPPCSRERNRLIANSRNSTKCSTHCPQYEKLAYIPVTGPYFASIDFNKFKETVNVPKLMSYFENIHQIWKTCEYFCKWAKYQIHSTKYWRLTDILENGFLHRKAGVHALDLAKLWIELNKQTKKLFRFF